MINTEEVFKIGKFIKPHGLKGEIALEFDNDVFDKVDCPYLICMIDSILVPFFVKEYRFKGNDIALITFDDVNTEQQAKMFSGLEVYFPREYFDIANEAVDYSLDFFLGFTVIDELAGEIGQIVEVNDSTINTLFLLEGKDMEEHIIPASDDFVIKIDEDNKILYVDLPIGLLD